MVARGLPICGFSELLPAAFEPFGERGFLVADFGGVAVAGVDCGGVGEGEDLGAD